MTGIEGGVFANPRSRKSGETWGTHGLSRVVQSGGDAVDGRGQSIIQFV